MADREYTKDQIAAMEAAVRATHKYALAITAHAEAQRLDGNDPGGVTVDDDLITLGKLSDQSCALVLRAVKLLDGALVMQVDGQDEVDAQVLLRREIERLTTMLHAVQAHPDYSYTVCPPGAISPFGWEPNPEAKFRGGMTEDTYWRRRLK